MERPKYNVAIPNEKYHLSKRLHIAFLVFFSVVLMYVSVINHTWSGIFWASFALLSLLGLTGKQKISADPLQANVWEVGFIWLCMGWFNSSYYWIGAIVFLISLMGVMVKGAYEIEFYNNDIRIKSFPKKTIKWFELNNVVLKDGLLTIDFKNDKIIQAEILPEESNVTSETDFNQFCSQQLVTHGLATSS
jgi:hypothetical protein